jgi:predicted Zn-dependent protease
MNSGKNIMRTPVLVGIVLLAGATATSPLCAMGGMGGYGGGGGMPSMGASAPMRLDDYSMAVRLINHEKYDEATPYLERALATHPHSADVLNYLGFVNRMVGKYSTSMGFYHQALIEDPDHKGAHEYLGELYLDVHNLTGAQGQLAELTRLCPSGCDELDVLTKAIATFEAAYPPTAAPAATPPTQSGGGN